MFSTHTVKLKQVCTVQFYFWWTVTNEI